MALRVVVLGSAQDGGLPQMAATHPNDTEAARQPKLRRTGAGLAVVQGAHCLFLDASPDLRTQYWDCLMPAYEGSGGGFGMDGVVLTHAHMGHYLGLAHLGKESANAQQLPCYCTQLMADFLSQNAPWSQLVAIGNLLPVVVPAARAASSLEEGTFEPWPGLKVRLFLVPHRAEFTDTVGISINEKLLYIPDIDQWDDWEGVALEEVKRHEISLVDATFYSKAEVEMLRRSYASIAHPPVEVSLELLAAHVREKSESNPAGGNRVIFTHLNHSNPLVMPGSAERAHVTSLGFEVAEDGMVIPL